MRRLPNDQFRFAISDDVPLASLWENPPGWRHWEKVARMRIQTEERRDTMKDEMDVLLSRRRSIESDLTHWLMDWAEFWRRHQLPGDPYACLDKIDDTARGLADGLGKGEIAHQRLKSMADGGTFSP